MAGLPRKITWSVEAIVAFLIKKGEENGRPLGYREIAQELKRLSNGTLIISQQSVWNIVDSAGIIKRRGSHKNKGLAAKTRRRFPILYDKRAFNRIKKGRSYREAADLIVCSLPSISEAVTRHSLQGLSRTRVQLLPAEVERRKRALIRTGSIRQAANLLVISEKTLNTWYSKNRLLFSKRVQKKISHTLSAREINRRQRVIEKRRCISKAARLLKINPSTLNKWYHDNQELFSEELKREIASQKFGAGESK